MRNTDRDDRRLYLHSLPMYLDTVSLIIGGQGSEKRFTASTDRLSHSSVPYQDDVNGCCLSQDSAADSLSCSQSSISEWSVTTLVSVADHMCLPTI